jgi:hypothetical protein
MLQPWLAETEIKCISYILNCINFMVISLYDLHKSELYSKYAAGRREN